MNENIIEEKQLKKATAKRVIKAGEIIPSEISFWYDGGSGWTNLASFWIDHLFKQELAKLQKEEYVFSEICRNENEEKAFYSALKINFEELGFEISYVN